MCRAAVNHLFPLLRGRGNRKYDSVRIHTAQDGYGRKEAYVTRCIIISGAYDTSYVVEPV